MGAVEQKVIVVTGAARGIGAAIARDLAMQGGRVVVADYRKETAAVVANEITGQGGAAIACFVDVSDRASVQSMVATTVREFGRLDVIFNNAGISKSMPFLDIDEQLWTDTIRINALGVLFCIQEAAKQMIKQGGGGKIVSTASIGGKQGYALYGHYNASKFAVVGMTQAAAKSLGEYGITVNCLAPGIVDTDMWDNPDAQKRSEELKAFAGGSILGRPTKPSEIAGVARFLASSESDIITGQTIMADGGMVFV